jgi:hypothetical protein
MFALVGMSCMKVADTNTNKCPIEKCPMNLNSLDSSVNNVSPKIDESIPTFKLPIQYLDDKDIHPISSIVSDDLELCKEKTTEKDPGTSNKGKSMYDIVFQPSHPFGEKMGKEWSKQFTSNIDFLEDSQRVVENMEGYSCHSTYKVNHKNIMDIWSSVREDKYFMEKYGFMEWNMLRYLNTSTSFLQSLSILNSISPLTSVLIPIILLLVPFVILKIRGISVDFKMYIDVLKDIARGHLIGKAITSLENFSMSNLGYLIAMGGLYFLQIYQNITSFFRFYNNIRKINTQLTELKSYIDYSIENMKWFIKTNEDVVTYEAFQTDIIHHIDTLEKLRDELRDIYEFRHSIHKFTQIGYMLRCYYLLHSVDEYADTLLFSFGFEGYLDNLKGIYRHLKKRVVNRGTFDISKSTNITQQYYPTHVLTEKKYIKNDCNLDKNIIITGVNASGKTTTLKMTAINIIFTQQFGFGFYESCSIHPYTHIHSYLNIPDTSGRDSLFQAESRRCKEIIQNIQDTETETETNTYIETNNHIESRHFCIFDELYSGTNPIEATKSAYAFLLYISKYKNVDFMLTTHYTSICQKIVETDRIENYEMVVEPIKDGFIYTYKLKKGICLIQGAIEILKSMDYPAEIIDTIVEYDV